MRASVRVCVCRSEAYAGSRRCVDRESGPCRLQAEAPEGGGLGRAGPVLPSRWGATQSGHRAPAAPLESPSWHPGAGSPLGVGGGDRGGRGHRDQTGVLRGGPAEPAAGTDGLCCLRQGPLAALCKLETSCLSWKMEESGVCHRGGGSHGRPEWLEGRQRARDLEPCPFLPGGQRGRRSGPQGPDLQRDVRLRAPQTLLPKTPHP